LETLKTILYFSVFNYPLKIEEICHFSAENNREKVMKELELLLEQNVIIQSDEFYLIDANLDQIEKRKKGNKMAVSALVKAQERARFISKFPFVEAVGVSGSLSKGYYDDNSDIDFFVITKPEKVWICRTFLMLYKKLFLMNSRKYFCINYFMSSCQLELEEKNRFTATEIKTLIPFQGKQVFEEFYHKNEWVHNILGEFKPDFNQIQHIRKPKPVKALEYLLGSPSGNLIDTSFRKITVSFWKMKFRQMRTDDFKVAMKSTKNISKHHPLNFQKKVIGSLNEKYDEIRRNHNIELTPEYV